MVKLTRIYTKTGDTGTTSLGNGKKVPKNDPRLEAVADVDEANASIGVAMTFIKDVDVLNVLLNIQNDLFDVGADLSTPVDDKNRLRITEEYITALESQIDRFNAELHDLTSFVLPSGSKASAHLHLARTVVRRAERRTWNAFNYYSEINGLAAKYLNRLSDLLFVLARYENTYGDVLWSPGSHSQIV